MSTRSSTLRALVLLLLPLLLPLLPLLSCSAAGPSASQAAPGAQGPRLPGDVRAAMVRGDWEGARALIDQRLASAPEQADLWLFLRGLALQFDAQGEAALSAFADLEQRFPESPWALKSLFQRAEILRAAGRQAQAEAIWEAQAKRLRSDERQGELAAIYFELADSLSTPATSPSAEKPRIDYEAAYGLYAAVLELAAPARDRARALLRMGLCRERQSKWADSARDCELFLAEFDPSRPTRGAQAPVLATSLEELLEVRLRLGSVLLEQHQRARARRALEDLASDVQAAREGRGAFAAAAAALDAAARTRLARLEGEARLRIGQTFQTVNAREALLAVAALRRYLEAAPGHAKAASALREIAALEARHGRTEQALAALEQLQALPAPATDENAEREEDARVRMQGQMEKGRLLLGQKRFDDAAAAFQEYAARFPSGPDWSAAQAQLVECEFQRAQDHRQNERFAEARAAWSAFLTARPLDARAAEVASAIGECFAAEAEALLARATRPSTSGGSAAQPGEADRARARELRASAVAEWRRVAQRFPESAPASQALLALGRQLEEHLGDLEGAVEAYRQCSSGPAAGEAARRLAALTRPSLTLATQGVWRGGGKPRVTAQVRNLERLRLSVYKLDLETYFRKHRGSTGIEQLDLDLIAADVSSEAEVAGYVRYAPLEQSLELPFAGPGTWVVAVTGGELRATTLVVASDLDVIVKSSPLEVFTFAQDVARGEPAPGTRVLVAIDSEQGPSVLELLTGADGVARASLEEQLRPTQITALALREGHVAALGLPLSGLQPARKLASRALVYTDRPAYRPGQAVHWRAILREVEQGQESIHAGGSCRVEAFDPAGRSFVREDLPLSTFGTLHGTLALDGAAASGRYRIVVRTPRGGVFEGAFEVQTYQLQKVDLSFSFARPVVQRGEAVEAEIRAAYHYGEPVADSPLRVSLPDGTQTDLRTDAQGLAKLSFDTRDLSVEGALPFSATLLEEGITRSGSVRLSQHEYSARLSVPQPVVLAGDRVTAKLVTRGPEDEPVGRSLSFALLRRESSPLGTWSEVEVLRQQAVTDDQTGEASIAVTLERGGSYLLRAEALDRFGTPVVAETAVFASGQEDEVRLRLIAERGEAEVGSTARLTVVNRSGAGLALLTLEGESVLEHRLLRLAEGSSTLEVRLPSAAFPRAWVAIARMDGQLLHAHEVPLTVVRKLDVQVEALQEVYEPGGRARLRLTARDQLGAPVQAEFSVAVVDEALFDLFPDRVPPLPRVFEVAPRSSLAVVTASSCTFAYAGSTVKIAEEVLAEERAREQQEQWDARRGQVREELRSLAEKGKAPAPAQTAEAGEPQQGADDFALGQGAPSAFGARRGRAGGPSSGGPGRGEQPALPESETAFWTATLVTGADGTAEAAFDLPGQSTRWRATCRGVGPETLLGEATATFRTRAELFLELRTPQQLVEGDRPRFVARVHNLTGGTGRFDLALCVQAGERTLTLPARLDLGAGAFTEHVFEALEALPACGTLALRLEGRGTLAGKERTSVLEREVPVRPYGLEGAASASGALTSDAVLELELGKDRAWGDRTLEVHLGPSLARLLLAEALGELTPLALRAGCLPPSTLADAAAELYGLTHVAALSAAAGGGRESDHARVLARAQSRIAELVAAQRDDGSWSWTSGPRGGAHVETSCLALAALARAAGSGLHVPPETLQSAAAFMTAAFRSAALQEDELKAQIVWALSVQGSDDFAAANRLHRARGGLSPAALGYTTLALLEMERAPMAAETAEALAARLQDAGGTRLRAPIEANRPWNVSSTEMTALAAYAIGRAQPASPRLEGLIAQLLAERPWAPARARGFALSALAWHLGRTQPGEQRSSVEVRVAGQPPQRAELSPDQPGAALRFAIPDGAPARVRVDLVLSGGGRPHYAAVLRGFSANVSVREAGGLRLSEQRAIAAPPVYRGREIPVGFSVTRQVQAWTNGVEHLPLGETATYRVQFRADPRVKDDDRSFDYLVLEVPLPAGTSLLKDSLGGNFVGWRLHEGTLVVELGQRSWNERFEFRLLATQPGRYRVPPAILRSAYDPARWASGPAHEFEVLPRGERSPDAYRPTPDELFHLGQAAYEAGEHELAWKQLSALYEGFGPQLHDQPLRTAAELLLYLSIGREAPAETVRYFEVLREKNPDLTIPFEKILAVGAAYRQLDEHERALLIFKAVVEETFGKDLKLVGALDAAKDANAALNTFARLVADYPDFPGALEAQLALSDRLLTLAPKAAEHASLRKAGRDRASLTVEGVQLLQRFLAMHPRDPLAPEAGLNLVNAYLAIEDYEQTAAVGRELAAVYSQPRYADSFLYASAVAEWYRGRDAQAQELLARIAAATYKDAAGVEQPSVNRDLALYILAQIHHARQEFGSAAGYYQKVEALFADAREALAGIREKRIACPEITTARPGEKVTLTLSHRNLERAEVLVYPVDLMTLYLREKTLANVSGIELAGISPTLRRTVELGRDAQLRLREHEVVLDLKQPGAYLVIARGGELHASGLVLVSDLDLEVREDPASGQLRIQVLRHSSAGYVKGAQVKVVGSASQRIVSGQTDPRGLFVAENVAGTSTVIARLGEREYAFFRGQRALMEATVGGARLEDFQSLEQLGEQGYFKNVLEQNRASQAERESRLKDEIQRDRKGVQVKQVK